MCQLWQMEVGSLILGDGHRNEGSTNRWYADA